MGAMSAWLAVSLIALSPTEQARPQRVSLVSMLAMPQAHDGKRVIVQGYVCPAGRGQYVLTLDRESCKDAFWGNAIDLDLSAVRKRMPSRATLLTVEGEFRSFIGSLIVDGTSPWGVIDATNVSGRTLP